MNSFLGRILGGLVVAAIIIGLKFYNKDSSASESKAHLMTLCETDQECVQAVEAHHDACFDESYQMRRRGSNFDTAGFLNCFNSKAGKQIFAAH